MVALHLYLHVHMEPLPYLDLGLEDPMLENLLPPLPMYIMLPSP